MKIEVSKAIDELKCQFGNAITARDDNQGGAYTIIEQVSLGENFIPRETWVGFHIPAQYPYSDIYPIFISNDVKRNDGVAFEAPITPGHNFEGRSAIQISRRNNAAQNGLQRATTKVLKVLAFLESLS